MERHHHQGQQDIAQGHKRRHDGSHFGNALHAANDHDAQEHGQADARCQRRHREGILHGHRSAVGLHCNQEEAAADERNGGKDNAQPPLAQALFNETERASAETALVRELVYLRQGGLHKRGRGAEERHHPHPEHCTRPAESDGRGHTHNVAGAHAARKGDAERLERGNAVGAAGLLAEERTEHEPEPAHLHQTRAYGKVQTHHQQQHHQRRIPYDVIYDGYHFLHVASYAFFFTFTPNRKKHEYFQECFLRCLVSP